MEQGKRKLATTLLAAASLSALSTPLHAITFAEPSDAGATLRTALSTATVAGPAGTALTAITGTINNANDADLFVLRITATTTFSATSTSTAGIDTSLFLFNSTGVAVIANDDANGATIQGAIPAGNSLLTTLAAGTYYLGISLSGNEPINTANQLLFTSDSTPTNVRGIAAGINPTTESSFNNGTFFAETGDYTITLASAATAVNPVPEPSTVVTLVFGAGAALASFRRVRRSTAA